MRASRGSSSTRATGRYGLFGLRSSVRVIWLPRIAGAEHDDRLGLVVGRTQVAVLDQPGHVAADHRQHQREERRQHGHRPRDQRAAEEPGEDERGDGDDGDAEAEHPDLVEAAVVVPAPVQAEAQSDEPLQDDCNGNGREHAGLVHRGDPHVVAQERRDGHGDGPRRGVDGELDQREGALQGDVQCGPALAAAPRSSTRR